MAKVNPKGLRDVVLNFGKSLAVEGSEEAMTEAANIVADAIIMGDVSDYNIAKNAWMEAGSSEDEAEKQALKELIVRVAMAGAGGMIMGAGTSGAGMAYSGLRNVLSAQNSRGTSGADSLLPPLPQNEAQTPGVFHQAAQQRALEEAKVTEDELSAIERMASDKGLKVSYVYDTTSGVDGF